VTDLAAGPPWGARWARLGLSPVAATELRRALLRALFATRLYDRTLGRHAPSDLRIPLAIRWPGDEARGAALLGEEGGPVAGSRLASLFRPGAQASPGALAEAHRFEWLADLFAAGAPARDRGRALVAAWLDSADRWSEPAWQAEVTATRIAAWIAHWDELVTRAPTEDPLRRRMLVSIARQASHLARVAASQASGRARLRAIKGLVLAGLALGGGWRRIEKPLALLEAELPAQLRPDGGHVSRNPAMQLEVLRDLIDIRTALRAARVTQPAGLQSAIDRMTPALRLFRHADGRLAQFNGSVEAFGSMLDLVLGRAEAKGRPPSRLPHTGFERLEAGKTVVLLDAGAPPGAGWDEAAHAGTLSFEMSHGRERLIVNCGGFHGASRDWCRAARATAAHSTLVVADTNSAELLPEGGFGRRAAKIECERQEEEGSHWVAASHDGYAPAFSLVHERQLFLSADGDDLRGEDRLEGQGGVGFAIRFHLHPSVEVSMLEGGAALLRLPSGVGWRLRAHGAQLSTTESVYLGGGEARKSQQLVLSGHVGSQGALVRWAIRRETRKPAADGA